MKCKDFQKEFDERNSALSSAAVIHLKECADCRQIERKQTHLWQMISNFKKIEAPKDFDFHVQARIAKAKSGDYTKTSFLPALRYVLPIGLIVTVLAFAAISGFNLFDNQNNTQTAESNLQIKQQISLPDNKSSGEIIVTDGQITEKSDNLVAKNQPPKISEKQNLRPENNGTIAPIPNSKSRQIKLNVKVADDGFAGSLDSAVKENPKVILPPNMTGNQTNKTPNEQNEAKIFTVEEVLSQIGIETVSETRVVKTIRENSLAERSGVRKGDVIEAIDGQKITGEPLGNKVFEGKTLTVLRDKEELEINLVSKQN